MPAYEGPIVDLDVHHRPRTDAELAQYLPKNWREYVLGNGLASIPLRPAQGVPSGTLSRERPFRLRKETDAWRNRDTSGELAGSRYEMLRDQLLDAYGYHRALLTHDLGEFACQTNRYLAVELCRAANDWTIEEWLSRDSRLVSVATVPSADPELAVAELRRAAAHEQIVGVLMSGNPVGRPFGDPHYHSLYAAAVDLGLVVNIHIAPSDRPSSTINAGGARGSFVEALSQLTQPGMQHLSSMVVHGVFEKFPTLQVVMTEFGLGWFPTYLWRLDSEYPLLRRESPWVKKLPSEYIREHVRFTTQPFEEGPKHSDLIEILETVEGIEDMLCFTTDYPHITMDDPLYIARRVPRSWHRKIFVENACRTYGWPVPVPWPVGAVS
jgi:predicted TIM-barrel fold metal-dependent hydrolase